MRGVEFSDDFMDYLNEAAYEADMSTSDFTRAVLAEVRSRGLAGRYATAAVEKGLVPMPRRRYRVSLPWVNHGRGRWAYKKWTLEKRGVVAHTNRNRLPGEGWFLSGPGFDPPLDLNEMSADKAKDLANDLLRGR